MITTVETRAPSGTLYLVGEESLDRKRDKNLFAILQRHQGSTDPLSLKLFEWGTRAITVLNGAPGSLDFSEVFKIISSDLDHAPIDRPVMANGRLWDRFVLEEVRRLFAGKNPYNDEPLEEGEDHVFAQEVLAFATEEVPDHAVDDVGEKPWIKRIDFSGVLDEEIKKMYRKLVKLQLKNERFAEDAALFVSGREELKLAAEAMRERAEREIAFVGKSYVELREWLSKRVETIRSIYTRQIRDLEAALLGARGEIETLSKELSRTNERVSHLEGEVRSLQHTIHDLRGRVASLENDRDDGCSVM